jgi:hypothetical protein
MRNFVHGKCSNCGAEVKKPYRLSSRRKSARRLYCSDECQSNGSAKIWTQKRAHNFWLKVDILSEQDCWEWRGYKDPNGYGRYGRIPAQRIAFELAKGAIGNLCVCHSCDNPPCCNPNHLWLGTQQENIIDMNKKGRGNISGLRRTNGHAP